MEHDAELHPEKMPQVNIDGIEELAGDKGYRSGPVLEKVKELEVRTYIPEKRPLWEPARRRLISRHRSGPCADCGLLSGLQFIGKI